MADQLDFSGVRVFDGNANPGAGYVARFYETGTTTPLTVYTSSGLGTPHGTSVTADADGVFAAVWSSGTVAVKCVIEDADGAIVQTIDPVFAHPNTTSAAEDISFSPTANVPATNVQDASELVDTNSRARDALLQPLDATLTSLSGLSLVAGDILYATAADTLVRLPKGTAGQVLSINSGGTAPEWVTPPFEKPPYSTEGAGDLALGAATLYTLAHGLGVAPKAFRYALVCQTSEHNYPVGRAVEVNPGENAVANASYGHSVSSDSTNIYVRCSATGQYQVMDATSGVAQIITAANWKLRILAFA